MRNQDLQVEELRCQMAALDEEIQERESDAAVLDTQVCNSQENALRLQQELDLQEGRAESVAAQPPGIRPSGGNSGDLGQVGCRAHPATGRGS